MPGSSFSGRPSETNQTRTLGEQTPPPMPKDLKGSHAKELWKVACEELNHILRIPDYAILKQCCQAFQMGQDATEARDTKMALSCFKQYEAHAKQIGLTPSSRRVVKEAPIVQSKEEDAFDAWLARGGLN